MKEQVKLSVVYSYPPEKVWQALTDCRILSVWLMKNDFEPRVGHKFKFESESLPGIKTLVHCEVLELEKPKRLTYTWQDNIAGEPSLVIWTLTPVEGGTQLQLKHQQTGYTTTLVPRKSIDFEQIDPRPGLFFYQQPVTNFNQQISTGSLQQMTRNEPNSIRDIDIIGSKEEWDYRLDRQLLQALRRYC